VADAAGAAQVAVELPTGIASTRQLGDWLANDNPALLDELRSGRVRVAVNQELIRRDAPIREGDEIAFLPPVSGG
jgi:molybdopterin converting factor subunit 1